MTFAKWVFIGAGIWGIVVLAPLYWLVDITGRHYAVPTEYPQFFYGFVSVAIAWQIAFLVIGSSPARLRRLMVPAAIEKLGWVTILAVLFWCGRISSADAQSAVPDLLLGILFIASLLTTRTVTNDDEGDSSR